ncbi:MAG TPA: hypothetical protein VHF06_15360 [Pseudonocardiaceae bacterium]|nr:hypothetical protein [Pseudonocardiaceae bacterium]
MTVALKPAQRRLAIQAAAGLACVAIVIVALWVVSGFAGSHASPTSGYQQVQATVTKEASCQGADQNDSISFALGGQQHQAKLDGCGYTPGEKMSVLVPAGFNGSTVMPMSEAAPGNSSGLSHRVAFVLLIVATVVGGACGYRLFRLKDGSAGGPAPVRPGLGSLFGRRPAPVRPVGGPEPEPDHDYHSDIRPVPRNIDPEATGVDWFEDSSAHMSPVPPPPDVQRRGDRT